MSKPPIMWPKNYKFSPLHKSKPISLSNNNSRASGPNKNGSYDLALIEGGVFTEGSCIRFKVKKISEIVGVGLALKNVVAGNSYQLDDCHGCFLLYMNGMSYSHSRWEENWMASEFKYGVGDVVRVETCDGWLLWVNETKKKEQRTEMELREEEWKSACFGVRLGCREDIVEIM